MDIRIKNNQVQITGEVITNFVFGHEIYGEGFYEALIKVFRKSGTYDEVPIMVSDRLVDVKSDWIGHLISVTGQLRTYNLHDGRKNKLKLYVFVREAEVIDALGDIATMDQNCIILDGYLCKKPVYRITHLGRELADVILAVNRPFGKSDYIPCICWGRNAGYVAGLDVGARCIIEGRIQSREYEKTLEDGSVEIRTAYEVSVWTIRVPEQGREER